MIDAALVSAFIDVESSWRRDAFLDDANGGSYGLAQIDFGTAQWVGYKGEASGLYQPRVNVPTLVKILSAISVDLQKHNMFSLDNLAAAYNSGLGHVLNGGTDAPYVAKIKEAFQFYTQAFSSASIPPI